MYGGRPVRLRDGAFEMPTNICQCAWVRGCVGAWGCWVWCVSVYSSRSFEELHRELSLDLPDPLHSLSPAASSTQRAPAAYTPLSSGGGRGAVGSAVSVSSNVPQCPTHGQVPVPLTP